MVFESGTEYKMTRPKSERSLSLFLTLSLSLGSDKRAHQHQVGSSPEEEQPLLIRIGRIMSKRLNIQFNFFSVKRNHQ